MSTRAQQAAAAAFPPTLLTTGNIYAPISPILVGTTQSSVIDLGLLAPPNSDSAFYTFHLVVTTANLDQSAYILFFPTSAAATAATVTASNGFPLPKNHLYERICATNFNGFFRVVGSGAAMGTLFVHRSS